MIRDITIGQYYYSGSVIHRLDPRFKIYWTILLLVTVFMINSIPTFLLVTGVLAAYVLMSRVPLKFIFRGLQAVYIIILITFFFAFFFNGGDTVLFRIGPVKATMEGLKNGLYMVMRITYLIIGASVLTLTTTPNQLTDGIEKGFAWLKVFHVPVHEGAMMMTIALRFIPILADEMDRIMKAQTSRGADFESGGVMQRARALVPLIVPLFMAAIRRAEDLAMAMEARCYHGGEGRTEMKPLSMKRRDYMAVVLAAVYLAAVLVRRFAV